MDYYSVIKANNSESNDNADIHAILSEWHEKLNQQKERNEKEPFVKTLLMNSRTFRNYFPVFVNNQPDFSCTGYFPQYPGSTEVIISEHLIDGKIVPLDKDGQLITKNWKPAELRPNLTYWDYANKEWEIQRMLFEPLPIPQVSWYALSIINHNITQEAIEDLKAEMESKIDALEAKYSKEFRELRYELAVADEELYLSMRQSKLQKIDINIPLPECYTVGYA